LIHIKDVEERNIAFQNLDDEDKRKEIAYDALYLVLTRQLNASDGLYWNYSLTNKTDNLTSSKELQNFLINDLPEDCEVCQRGLMMVSQIRLGNTITPSDSFKMDGCNSNIFGFNMRSFKKMEDAYEGCGEVRSFPYISNTQEMLGNICCNVIANGDFISIDETDYLKLWNLKIRKSTVKTSIKKVFGIQSLLKK
jgi:hypothetical protein